MAFTNYAKEMGYDKGACAPEGALTPAAPPAAQIAGTFHTAEDLANEVQRFLDRLLGPVPTTGETGKPSPHPSAMVPDLLETAAATGLTVRMAHRRLLDAAEYLGLLHGGSNG